MSTKSEQLQKLVGMFCKAKNVTTFALRDVARWAIQQGYWKPHPELIETQCAHELADALRDEMLIDPQGRKIRTKHAAIDPKHPEQGILWEDIRTASPSHMKRSFEARRLQILGDCKQLKTDLDSYNENQNRKKPIQMSFDFTDDLLYVKFNKNKPKNSPLHLH